MSSEISSSLVRLFTGGRYAGLRIPSEIVRMKISDFGSDGFFVHCETKTGRREVPFFHELRPMFERIRRGIGKNDTIYPPSWKGPSYAWKVFERSILRAGVEKWPRLFNNLRASCITDYDDMGYSEKTLDAIFGNSEQIRKRHYVNFRRDKKFMEILNTRIPIVEYLSSLGGTIDGDNVAKNIDILIQKLESLKTS